MAIPGFLHSFISQETSGCLHPLAAVKMGYAWLSERLLATPEQAPRHETDKQYVNRAISFLRLYTVLSLPASLSPSPFLFLRLFSLSILLSDITS